MSPDFRPMCNQYSMRPNSGESGYEIRHGVALQDWDEYRADSGGFPEDCMDRLRSFEIWDTPRLEGHAHASVRPWHPSNVARVPWFTLA